MGKKKVFCPNCGQKMVDVSILPSFVCCETCRCFIDAKGRIYNKMSIAALAAEYVRQGKEDEADRLAIEKLEE